MGHTVWRRKSDPRHQRLTNPGNAFNRPDAAALCQLAGRLKLGTQNAQGVFISSRLTPVEAKQIESAIAQSRLSNSQFVIKVLLSAANVLNV